MCVQVFPLLFWSSPHKTRKKETIESSLGMAMIYPVTEACQDGTGHSCFEHFDQAWDVGQSGGEHNYMFLRGVESVSVPTCPPRPRLSLLGLMHQDFLKENNQKELSMHEQMMLRQAAAEESVVSGFV